jgi:hypothetical protein
MIDIDTINQNNRVDYLIEQDEKETKSRILKIVDPVKKQREWNKYFTPQSVPSDDWMLQALEANTF